MPIVAAPGKPTSGFLPHNDGNTMQWTQDQQAASAAFSHFMIMPDDEMVLSGGAGTGKTTLLKHWMDMQEPHLMRSLAGQNPIKRWELTATTNKAAEVLSNATGRETSTIHSFLGLKVQNDFSSGSVKLVKTKNYKVISDTLIVIDEASMVDRNLRKLIQEATLNCKIIYVGDHCQLAPVGETLSPVFDVPNRAFLNTIVRSMGAPAITALSLQLRETVETGIFKPIHEVPGVIDYLSPEEAAAEIKQRFVDMPLEDQAERPARILCYTNDQVINYNNHVRRLRGKPRHLVPGDWVISNSVAKSFEGKQTRVEQELLVHTVGDIRDFEIYDGKDILVLKVRDVKTNLGTFPVAEDRDHLTQLISYFGKKADWGNRYMLSEEIADFRPRDACTTHKSQGSTYDTVYVDLKDIGTCRNPAALARLLYVACSRPTRRIVLMGGLPPKYAG